MKKNKSMSMDELIAYVNGQAGDFIIHVELQTAAINEEALKQYQSFSNR